MMFHLYTIPLSLHREKLLITTNDADVKSCNGRKKLKKLKKYRNLMKNQPTKLCQVSQSSNQ